MFSTPKDLSVPINVSSTSDYFDVDVSPNFYAIYNANHLRVFGIIVSSNCSFEHFIIELCKWCTVFFFCGWIIENLRENI